MNISASFDPVLGMTIGPAYASFTEDSLGSLEIGKRADFVILSQNIMEVPASWVPWTKVEATVIDGRPVYGTI
jgi:predicted amidohydrolase YtcJ